MLLNFIKNCTTCVLGVALFGCVTLGKTYAAQEIPWYENGAAAVLKRAQAPVNTKKAKNVILIVGDGMSITTLTAGRIYEGQLQGKKGEENWLSFERFPYTGLVKTYSTDMQVPDSAATASAMMTGIKTKSGFVNVSEHQMSNGCGGISANTVPSLAELAEARGMMTGVVTNTTITHATPATVYAHTPQRGWEYDGAIAETERAKGCKDIAAQLIDFKGGNGLDVAMGGGKRYFQPKGVGGGRRLDGRDLTKEWLESESSAYVTTRDGLLDIDPSKTKKLLGLFSNSHMDFELDRPDTQPSLSDMATKAIEMLSQSENGYFLMIESGKIDHAHHGGNAARALREMAELSATIKQILTMVDLEETLILVTADHAHTLTMVGYTERGNDILGLVKEGGENVLAADGKPYTTLHYANGPGAVSREAEALTDEKVADPNYKQQSLVPMGSETHAGEDVALFAVGPRAYVVRGTIEQNEIFHIMRYALGWMDNE